jgi:hypothetical protein
MFTATCFFARPTRRDGCRPSRRPNDNQKGIGKAFGIIIAAMSESNDSRIEARECLRKANRGDDSQNRWAWLVLAKTWLLLAKTQEISENSIEAGGQELTHLEG